MTERNKLVLDEPTPLWARVVAGVMMCSLFWMLALIVPLWPVTMPLFFIMGLGALAGAFKVNNVWSSHCPYCDQDIKVTKVLGGIKCPGCGSPISIRDCELHKI